MIQQARKNENHTDFEAAENSGAGNYHYSYYYLKVRILKSDYVKFWFFRADKYFEGWTRFLKP